MDINMVNKDKRGITILGLGPGKPEKITREVWEILESTQKLYLKCKQDIFMQWLPENIEIHSFDKYYDESKDINEIVNKIVKNVIELGERPEGVIYAVPGHPLIADATTPKIIEEAKESGVPVYVIEGMSILEPTLKVLGINQYENLMLIDALALVPLHHIHYPPSIPALLTQIYSKNIASEIKKVLMNSYPADHIVTLVHFAGTDKEIVEPISLRAFDLSENISWMTNLYIPPLEKETSFENFQETVAHLRAPDGCPWDKEQTHRSLRANLLEETYETLSAIDDEDYEAMAEEFGDLLLQIVLHAQIGNEAGKFSMEDVVRGINNKIVHRHPHVFGDLTVKNVDGVMINWERLKAEERKNNVKKINDGLMDSVPTILPSLELAQEFQGRVARVGFDWPDIEGVLQKVQEEYIEVQNANSEIEIDNEVGDLLFAVVNLARWLNVNAESALRVASNRFRNRFKHIEEYARETGKELSDMTLTEMDNLWNEAKGLEK